MWTGENRRPRNRRTRWRAHAHPTADVPAYANVPANTLRQRRSLYPGGNQRACSNSQNLFGDRAGKEKLRHKDVMPAASRELNLRVSREHVEDNSNPVNHPLHHRVRGDMPAAGRFRMRGLGKVAAEFALAATALNLTRMWRLDPPVEPSA
jgi:hypothetical protein